MISWLWSCAVGLMVAGRQDNEWWLQMIGLLWSLFCAKMAEHEWERRR